MVMIPQVFNYINLYKRTETCMAWVLMKMTTQRLSHLPHLGKFQALVDKLSYAVLVKTSWFFSKIISLAHSLTNRCMSF